MNIDYNVANYTDNDLRNIIGLEENYNENGLNDKLVDFSSMFLQTDKNDIHGEQKINFIVDIRDRLMKTINHLFDTNTVVEGVDDTLENVKEEDKVEDIGRINEVIGDSNIKTKVFDKFVTIDSTFRRIYDQQCSCEDTEKSTFKIDTPDDFTVTFNDKITNVVSIEINSLELTHAWYNFQNNKGNTSFKIDGNVVIIQDGNYLPAIMANQLQNANTNILNLTSVLDDNDSNDDLTYEYHITKDKISITNSGGADISLCFYDEDLGNNHNAKLDYNLGQCLGFTKQTYTIKAGETLIGENTLNLYGPKYFYLAIDDYTNSYFTQSMTMQSINKDIFKQSKYFRDSEYQRDVNDRTNIPKYSREGSRQPLAKTIDKKLTISQKKTIEEIKLAQENKYQNRAYGPNVMDIIGRIPIDYDPSDEVKRWKPIIYQSLKQYKREYLKPVNINKLRIRLFDDKGFPLGMNNDWSMSLIFKTNYKYTI